MSATDAAMEAALLKIAKDLLQASDDLASTDPASSAKLAHEAYEIGRDLGIVRDHVDDATATSTTFASHVNGETTSIYHRGSVGNEGDTLQGTVYRHRDTEDNADTDADLFRILDRQKAMLPKPVELAPARDPAHDARPLTFEATPRRSSWFAWMRSREWRHAG